MWEPYLKQLYPEEPLGTIGNKCWERRFPEEKRAINKFPWK
jgi:hypothetical protein